MLRASSFTFVKYTVDRKRSVVTFTYRVAFKNGTQITLTDRLILKGVTPDRWETIPEAVRESSLQALLLMLGINYWCVFPTRQIRIEGFVLSKDQAQFWDTLYLNGLAEYFYDMQMDFTGLIAFPYDAEAVPKAPMRLVRKKRSLLLNGAGKDSILSAEMLKEAQATFDFFALDPTPAQMRIAGLVGADSITVRRKRDPKISVLASLLNVSNAYPSVSTFTFVAVLLAALLDYDSIVFSNERSADVGNFIYRGLPVNHQWCKSSEAEKLINDYIHTFITPDIATRSLLRTLSELEIVRRFIRFPQYLHYVTSCNTYFWLPWPMQLMSRKSYWCTSCPKCVFLFACYAAFLPKKEVVAMFGGDLYARRRLLPTVRSILGIQGFKPLDCVGEPEEMVLAMRYAYVRGEYNGEPAMQVFETHFPSTYDFHSAARKVFNASDVC